jgi:HEAT repeat protein
VTVTRRGKIAVLLLTVALGGSAFVAWMVYLAEPVYRGKRLSAWAEQYRTNKWTANQAAARDAEVAIRQIGSDAIPFLLEQLRTEESRAKKKLRELLSPKWHNALHLKDTSGDTRRTGAYGLVALSTNAPPTVVPQLIEIAIHHPEEDGRYIAVFSLSRLGPRAEPAIPFFIQCLTNTCAIIREEGAVGLGMVRRQPEIAIPVLMKYLESARASPHSFEPRAAIVSLGNFGTNAKPAVPLLLSFLNHEKVDLREAVTNNLPRIDADAARTHLR